MSLRQSGSAAGDVRSSDKVIDEGQDLMVEERRTPPRYHAASRSRSTSATSGMPST
jgi:hypothetical protein